MASEQVSTTKAALLAALKERKLQGAPSQPTPVPQIDRSKPFALSPQQRRLWFLQAWSTEPALYHIPLAVRLQGPLKVEALAQTLRAIVTRHEALRTVIQPGPSGPLGRLLPTLDPTFEYHSLRDLSPAEQEQALHELGERVAKLPFDLAKGPLMRATLVDLGADMHQLFLTLHHIAADGWSMGVLVREMSALYQAFSSGEPNPLPPLAWNLLDWIDQQERWGQGPAAQAAHQFWRSHLAGAPAALTLPTDRPRPATASNRGAAIPLALPADLLAGIEQLATGEGATLFMALQAAFGLLLGRYAGQEQVVIGTPVAGRTRPEAEGLIACLVNTLALPIDLSGAPSFRTLLQRVRQITLGAFEHQTLPFEEVVAALAPERDGSRTPFFQVMLALHNAPMPPLRVGDLILSALPIDTQTAKFDLTMELWPEAQGLAGRLEYRTDLWDRTTIERLWTHFLQVIRAAIAQPDQPAGALSLLTPAEQEAIDHWNRPARSFPAEGTLQAWFEAQVAAQPEAPALTFQGESLTYRELNARANQLAHHLREQGVGPERLVGLYLDRSPRLVIAILAVLKAGGAYLPLDPLYPTERVQFVMADAGAHLLLSEAALVARLPEPPVPLLVWEELTEALAAASTANPEPVNQPTDLCYVIYTSGSTGRPKGVLIEHRNVLRLFTGTNDWYQFGPNDVWTLFHSYAFDFSVWEIWGALLYGGRLVIAEYVISRSPEAFYDLLQREGVTVLNQTPSAFRQLIRVDGERDQRIDSLRYVIFGGEALELQSLRLWFERHGDTAPRLVNMYGITETTVHVTYRPIRLADLDAGAGSVIGEPIPDLSLLVLDEWGGLVPVGVPGELYVGGAGVARGYLNRPELTAARFLPDPHCPSGLLYRTGDLARRLPTGDLEYLGRIDHQVKVRGFRIELGEIESALVQVPGVAEAIVLVREDRQGEKQLVGYLVAEPGATLTGASVRGALLPNLPEYMIPTAFVLLPAIPLTENGKVDRAALPLPEEGRLALGSSFTPPTTPLEELLAAIWSEVLEQEQIGIHDPFFALGGDSIRALQVVSRAKERGLDLTLQALFQHQTIAELVGALAGFSGSGGNLTAPYHGLDPADRERLPVGVEDAYPLSALQAGMLYHLTYTPDSTLYHNITVLKMTGPVDRGALTGAFAHLIARHPILRTGFAPVGLREPLQLVWTSAPAAVGYSDLQALTESEQEASIDRWMVGEKGYRWDLAQPPLLRLHLMHRGPNRFDLCVTECHAILDGWSLTSLIQELFASYLMIVRGEALPTPATPALAFRDFIWLERETARSPVSLGFWQERMAGAPVTRVPRLDPADEAGGLRRLTQRFELPVVEGLRRVARDAGVPLKSVLLAVHLKALSLIAGTEDLVTGLVVNGRPEAPGADQVRGLFLNSIPLRVQVEDSTWIDLARRLFAVERAMMEHRRFPLPVLQKALGRSPLFETSFNFVNFRPLGDVVASGELQILDLVEYAETNFTWQAAFNLLPGVGELLLFLDANGAEITAAQHELYATLYGSIITALVARPTERHATFSLPLGLRLPEPVDAPESTVVTTAAPEAPVTTPMTADQRVVAAKLQAIWREVLRVAQVGLDENFFSLGGDSILAFQVVSAAAAEGIQITPRQLFEHPTVRGLAVAAEASPAAVVAAGAIPDGPVPLTPIQRWFFDQSLAEPDHYNQAMLLELDQSPDPAALRSALGALIDRHDALRMRFTRGPEGVRQGVQPAVEPPLTVVDLSELDPTEQALRVEAMADVTQATLSLAEGRLLQAVLFDCGPEQPARLLLVIHHLAVDGVSWRVLLTELRQALTDPHALGARPTSFAQWAHLIAAPATVERFAGEIPYWQEQVATGESPTDAHGMNLVEHERHLHTYLTPEETDQLLREAPKAHSAETQDLLLAALAQALSEWQSTEESLIELEGHGREEIGPQIDLSRTVGWFTTLFPMRLKLVPGLSPGALVRSVRAQRRQIPNRGIGYGILRFLHPDPEVRASLAGAGRPVRFNYLGQFDNLIDPTGGARRSSLSVGRLLSPLGQRPYLIGVDAAVVAGRLELQWSYSVGHHSAAAIQELADRYLVSLRRLLQATFEPVAATPADFPRANLNQSQLDRLLAKLSRQGGGRES